ncbi:hemoglobin subunit beta-2-like [Discoglossus pictus]
MVHWTAEERSAINFVWGKLDPAHDGGDALGRLLLVFPWTQRYFSSFGNLSGASNIASNAKVQAHGKKVLAAIGNTIQHLDDVKGFLDKLSKSHAQDLHVDPQNFKLFGSVLVIVVSSKLGAAFTPQVQAAWEKFTAVLVAGLSHGYH